MGEEYAPLYEFILKTSVCPRSSRLPATNRKITWLLTRRAASHDIGALLHRQQAKPRRTSVGESQPVFAPHMLGALRPHAVISMVDCSNIRIAEAPAWIHDGAQSGPSPGPHGGRAPCRMSSI
jgi:hypothetical protein